MALQVTEVKLSLFVPVITDSVTKRSIATRHAATKWV